MGNDNWIDISKTDAIICISSLGVWAILWYLAATALAL